MQTEPRTSICAASVILRVLKGRWAAQVILAISSGKSIHFSALKRSIAGISAKMLTEQLRYLERALVVSRQPSAINQEVAYSLTARGREIKKVLDSFDDLALRWEDL